MRTLRPIAFVLVAVAAVSCAKCRRAGGASQVSALIPVDAQGALVVEDLARLGQKLQILETLKVADVGAQLLQAPNAKALVDGAMAQLGFDVRSREGLEKAGIQPGAGMAVVQLAPGQSYLAVGVKNQDALEKTLLRLAGDRLGARKKRTEQQAGKAVQLLSREDNGTPMFAYVFAGGHALLTGDASVIPNLGRYATLPAKESLKDDKRLEAGLSRLGGERDLFFFTSHARLRGQVVPIIATLLLEKTGLRVRTDAPIAVAADVLKPKPGAALLGYLSEDTFLTVGVSADAAPWAPYAPRVLGPRLMAMLQAAELDPKVLFEQLRPGSVLGISLAPEARMVGGMPALDVRQTNPFRFVHLAGVAEVKDPAQAAKLLDQVAKAGPKFGATVEKAEREGSSVYLTRYAQGEGAHFAQADNRVVVAAPEAKLLATLKKVKAGPSPAPKFGTVFSESGAAIRLDLLRLAAAIRALPDEAWGLGGFAMKATALRWLDAIGDLEAVTVTFSGNRGAVLVDTHLGFNAK